MKHYFTNVYVTLERAERMLKKPIEAIREKLQEHGYCTDRGIPTQKALNSMVAIKVWQRYDDRTRQLIDKYFKEPREKHETYVRVVFEWDYKKIASILD